ncbi:DMT family transporter [Clostridium sp.]|uniref:DMT family transporter n=1 Tax=Clostridium sp. TaxID=1506 RepID=UPI002603C16A|nr:DMT family transporter [Clostridium sp.]
MYKNLAFLNGIILAIMVFLNGMLSSKVGAYIGTLIYHILRLLIIVIVSLITKNKFSNPKKVMPIFLLPGTLSVVTILLNNIAIPHIGVTLAVGVGLFGQIIMSSFTEHFGLFGMPANRLKKEKLLGLSIIAIGLLIMITM